MPLRLDVLAIAMWFTWIKIASWHGIKFLWQLEREKRGEQG